MATKAKWWQYINALLDPNVAVDSDGNLVYAEGWFDGDGSHALSDEAVKLFNTNAANRSWFDFLTGNYSDPYYAQRVAEAQTQAYGGATPVEQVSDVTSKLRNRYGENHNLYRFWENLTSVEKEALLNQYGNAVSTEDLLSDLAELSNIEDFSYTPPVLSDYVAPQPMAPRSVP